MVKRIRNQAVGDTVFDLIIALFLLIAVVVCVYPFLYVLSISISSGEAVNKGLVTLLPVDLNFDAMKTVLGYRQLWTSYGNTLFYTHDIERDIHVSGGVSAVQEEVLLPQAPEFSAGVHDVFLGRTDSFLYHRHQLRAVQQPLGYDYSGSGKRI